jgi:hypothetical protein
MQAEGKNAAHELENQCARWEMRFCSAVVPSLASGQTQGMAPSNSLEAAQAKPSHQPIIATTVQNNHKVMNQRRLARAETP